MGWRYIQFRIRYELLLRTGLLKKRFPIKPGFCQYISLAAWRSERPLFFFANGGVLQFQKDPNPAISNTFFKIKEGKFPFFNSIEFELGKRYDWVTNPETGFRYDIHKHWTEITDYSKEAGDIKYVWEKSRFSYLYDIIRYDYHFGEDCGEFVFEEIISWIDANPLNCGPNYRCSQETSLRVLNWTFALFYYRSSGYLTNEIFDKIQFSIYWQINHVYRNINFSRIAVRNNHAITETLTLYLIGMLFPEYPDSEKWKVNGRKWFEEEIAYQVYDDGTFLQFSMNYHRVVIQLLTWAIVLSEKNKERFAPVVYDRAEKSVKFLRTCMVEENGYLPNYGANDGALFFKLNNSGYRDYRPALAALATSLHIDLGFDDLPEDISWYQIPVNQNKKWIPAIGLHSFSAGGYYLFREKDTLTFIRCGNHKDRPSQADNLHLDVWYKGQNILLDSGSYKYNTDDATLKYFMGTASHNTVMLGEYDQMLKGGRFIWYYWSGVQDVFIEEDDGYTFKGSIKAFGYISKEIIHQREIFKKKGVPSWSVKDTIFNKPEFVSEMKQSWHLPVSQTQIIWDSHDQEKNEIAPERKKGFASSLYGKKEMTETIIFKSETNMIRTCFKITSIGIK